MPDATEQRDALLGGTAPLVMCDFSREIDRSRQSTSRFPPLTSLSSFAIAR